MATVATTHVNYSHCRWINLQQPRVQSETGTVRPQQEAVGPGGGAQQSGVHVTDGVPGGHRAEGEGGHQGVQVGRTELCDGVGLRVPLSRRAPPGVLHGGTAHRVQKESRSVMAVV